METISIFLDGSFHGTKQPFLTIIITTLVTLLVGYFISRIFPFIGKNLPPGSFGLPFIGESISFLKAQKHDKTNEWLADRIKKFGPYFKTSLMGSNVVVITGQIGNRFVFSAGDNGIASNQMKPVARILGEDNIFEASGSRHKLVRGAIMSFLKPESLQRFVGQIDSVVKKQLFQELKDNDSVKAVTMIKIISFKVTCNLLLGLSEGKVQDALMKDFVIALKGTWQIPLEIPGSIFRKAVQARNRITNVLSELIKKRRMEIEGLKEGSLPKDIIPTFIFLRDENGNALPEKEIIDNLVTLVIGSNGTTTIVLSFLLRHLARNVDIYEKVLEEQLEVLEAREASDEMLGWRELQMMKYTWRVVQELMRISPPLFGNFKRASKDISFNGFDIPKGWQILWATSPTHMDKEIFEEPDKFDPSRFENPSKSIPSYTYIPFGAGPRICPGVELARIQVLLIIHNLITNYEWKEMIPNEPITREPLPYPAMGLPIKVHPRKSM